VNDCDLLNLLDLNIFFYIERRWWVWKCWMRSITLLLISVLDDKQGLRILD